ncbi:Phosphoinositide-3-kinase-interacting protein 1 [Labeo rohita]|uniref:Phosphoinositide-3-kinase-interacting protein 1 n=1 Tax=Labeo rohita TaxID=84645 RepID=A0ABQ8MRJ9_LABRO|nr:Phosphoinositide-3-kinase-interacting protein 1 [Labeo rohita]
MKMFQLLYFVFLLSSGLVDCFSVVEECITSNGEDYRGIQQKTSTGNSCLNWKSLNSQTDQNSTEAMAPEESVTPRMVETFENSDSFPSQVEGAAVQPVKAVRQQVRSGPKKKKDLGTLGYVLAVFMMAIIILLGGGITMGYFYKRGRDLKKQHEQRVYEREMHRITLPLSAFANPTCELVDENTIVITAEPNNQTPTQEPVEGADPLMGTAGTPGA